MKKLQHPTSQLARSLQEELLKELEQQDPTIDMNNELDELDDILPSASPLPEVLFPNRNPGQKLMRAAYDFKQRKDNETTRQDWQQVAPNIATK